MQSEVPALPVVCNEGKKRSARNTEVNDQSSAVQVKNHNTCKFSSKLVSNRKQLHPLVGDPYRTSMRLYTLSEPIRPSNKTTIGQRVMSAKMLRIKQLQNQLADAHYHLNELANENRLLKALQKRQDSALRKYEGANAELPRIINSHHEELKVLQTKHKKLKMQYRQACDLLKEKDNEIHLLQTQNKHLTQLSKDRHLEEREKLQTKVSDLNYRIEQQQDTIQTLNRKLALESKSLKHQLHQEVAKHKETQKHLHETLEKLKTLEDLLDNREKRLYYSGRLPACNKGKSLGSQSLMNLGQNGGSSNPPKSGRKPRIPNGNENGSLPKLTKTEQSDGKTIPNAKDGDRMEEITETMSSLQQVRKFRLQKSYSRNGSTSMLNMTDKSEEDESGRNESEFVAKYSSMEKLRTKPMSEVDSDEEEIKKIVSEFENTKTPFKLSKKLMREYGYSSSEDSESETGLRNEKETEILAKKSRDLHTRLIAEESSRRSDSNKSRKKNSSSSSESESEGKNRVINSPKLMQDYGVVLQQGKTIGSGVTDDFLKLDIAADSDAEIERLKMALNPEVSEKPTEILSGSYEDAQKRLESASKSWSEIQAKIARDREISEKQLKALDEEILEDKFLVEQKLCTVDNDEGLSIEKNYTVYEKSESVGKTLERTSRDSIRSQRRIGSLTGISVEKNELSRPQQSFQAEDSQISDIASSRIDTNEEQTDRKDLESLTTSSDVKDVSFDRKDTSFKNSDKLVENGLLSDRVDEPDVKLINYNKQKLLAAMKAIDDNENIDFSSPQKFRSINSAVRSQSIAMENLFRGLPAHARKKDDLLKEIFGDGKVESKLRAGCSKLH